MNEDHSDANLLYIKAWGNKKDSVSAIMTTISPDTINFEVVDKNGITATDSVTIDPPLNDPEQLHAKLISMLRKARKELGIEKVTNAK